MRERVGFIGLVEGSDLTFAEICERYGISRKTGYKWVARYLEAGPGGLAERSRRPHHSPSATPGRVAEALTELQETPGCAYERSAGQFPRKLPEIEYPNHFEIRYVSENGGIRWKKCWVNVTMTLAREWVGLEDVGDGHWDVYFSRLRLGRLDEHDGSGEEA